MKSLEPCKHCKSIPIIEPGMFSWQIYHQCYYSGKHVIINISNKYKKNIYKSWNLMQSKHKTGVRKWKI